MDGPRDFYSGGSIVLAVRWGLFVAGVAVGVIGAFLIVALFFLPPIPLDTRTSSVSISDLGGNLTNQWSLTVDPAFAGTLTLQWTSQNPFSVSLWNASSCSAAGGTCPTGNQSVVSWYGKVSGSWTYQGTTRSLYLLFVQNLGHTPSPFSATLTETYTVSTPSQLVPAWAFILLGGLVLLGIGGVTTFLGIFLESGVYGPPGVGPVGDEAQDLLPPELEPPTGPDRATGGGTVR